jgi:hypothetical protein
MCPSSGSKSILVQKNNEAKIRRSTTSVVLGKAKVISYEDLERARVKRAAKEEATTEKGKRGRKRKSPTPEGGMSEAQTVVTRMSEVPEPWRAPVARVI